MVFVIYKNVILSIEYCTQHSVQELSSSLFYSTSGGQFSENVTPGKLFMFIPGRKPVPAIPWMMLFAGTVLCENELTCVFRRAPVDAQIHSNIL